MFASSAGSPARRRGIVLVVVLGMLGLMALIGVTFATFAGQSLIASRNFGQGVARPQAEALMDFALAQLINDTSNPVSSIRGHSLLRDMYGNDSVFRGSIPSANPAAETGGLLSQVYSQSANAGNGGYIPPQMTLMGPRSKNNNITTATPFYNQIQFQTNIPTFGQYYGIDFTRWILKIQGAPANVFGNPPTNGFAAQTFEVLEDYAPPGGYHQFTLSNSLGNPTTDPRNTNAQPLVPSDWNTFLYADANYINPGPSSGVVNIGTAQAPVYSFTKSAVSLAPEWVPGITFTLDGRNMRAFNGPGLTSLAVRQDASGNPIDVYPYNYAAYANNRLTGYDPDFKGMDEDYDACDLENWFLALQSADGQVVIPSFHRPGILMASDWTANRFAVPGLYQAAKILRPRQFDNSPLFPADPSVPDAFGKLTYDIDNDGDGVTDSVWVDLGYSVQRDPGGKLYKPLFAFMVLGLNGRLPLNTVGNLQARANPDVTNNATAQAPNPGLPITTGQIPQPGVFYNDQNVPATYYKPMQYNAFFPPVVPSSQTYYDAPLWDHASHLGYSVNEINPKFALQNAPSNLYFSATSAAGPAIGTNVNGNNYSQVDNAGVSVALTQMRNILAGTIPTDLPYPLPPNSYPITTSSYPNEANGDVNVVMVNGQYMVLPNNVADNLDLNFTGQPGPSQGGLPYAVTRNLPAVAGRWGEPSGILLTATLPGAFSPPFDNPPAGLSSNPLMVYPGLIYNNPVRAGRSAFVNSKFGFAQADYNSIVNSNDLMDDDLDGSDPMLASYGLASLYYQAYQPPNAYVSVQIPPNNSPLGNIRNLPEAAENFDRIGQAALASERARRFVTPIDPGGVGRVVDFMNRPNSDYDYGKGYDTKGRTSYFRYFRTPGMPLQILYPYGGPGSTYPSYPNTNSPQGIVSNYSGHQYVMPQFYPAGALYPYFVPFTGAPTMMVSGSSDVYNNRYHGYQSMLTPEIQGPPNAPPGFRQIQTIAAMAPMPYDWDNSLPLVSYPVGYPSMPGTVITGPPYPSAPPLGMNYVNTFAPTIDPFFPVSANVNPIGTSINSSNGPNFGGFGNPGSTNPMYPPMLPIGYGGYVNPTDTVPIFAPVVHGYIGGGLNKDEADEMNLYTTSRYDMPYGPSDLEWLYRLQDVDGATLDSRLAKLAPVSFLNPADGLTRRRMFSTDSWEPTGWVYANDNPAPYAGAAYNNSTDHSFAYNSRFTPTASPSLELMNQIDGTVVFPNGYAGAPAFVVNPFANPVVAANMANPITTEFLPNPTLPTISDRQTNSFSEAYPNSSSSGATGLPTPLRTGGANIFQPSNLPVVSTEANTALNFGTNSMVQVQTPPLAHRDRRINLNYPLPISADPAEPIRQKWCRETYTLLKAILPPAAVDTPEELAALSQFVVNIIDFRDPDCSMTRFVNTDLIVTDVLTKTASPIQPTPNTTPPNNGTNYDTTWNVSPGGVRFATSADAQFLTTTSTINSQSVSVIHFPYDPTIYTPDLTTPFLVQHGMEYNPIAINEVLGFQSMYATQSMVGAPPTIIPSPFQGLFIELVNTLTEEQNNNNSNNNASAIPLVGWDLIIAPDDYGWGRPDPISGDVSSIAYPPLLVNPGMGAGNPPPANVSTSGTPLTQVHQFPLTNANIVQAINGGMPNSNIQVIGTRIAPGTNVLVQNPGPSATNFTTFQNSAPNFLPTTFVPTLPAGKQAQYFWIYLRRPANPFDTAPLNGDRPNREMVVVDAMRFPFINAGMATVAGSMVNSPNTVYSARRLQPYRGGHLLTVNSAAETGATLYDGVHDSPAKGITTICPPSPGYAYGYSEQTCPANLNPATDIAGQYKPAMGALQTSTKTFRQSIGTLGSPNDDNWSHFPFNDRDFTSVAELLLVPGCPPGLFTKQFVEEPYPGNVVAKEITNYQTAPTVVPANPQPVTYATAVQYFTTYAGSDDALLQMNITNAPSPYTDSTLMPVVASGNTTIGRKRTFNSNVGQPNFGRMPPFGTTPASPAATPVAPTFPYLPDNFYYTAASVAPPSGNYPPYYGLTGLTTEIGGWTGNGWHKMMEFLEVPSSANGATGTADGGFNFDWARADVKPGLLNLNLIIDEEVFAGLFDDPRLNERLAAYAPGSPTLPQVVTQIDGNGYPTARYPIFNLPGQASVNQLSLPIDGGSYVNLSNAPGLQQANAGRGYVVRDPDSQNYALLTNTNIFPYQQLHGLKGAFSDFLKLRHGGSGHLFAHGAGPVGSGDVVPAPILFQNRPLPTQPIASDRPYRSLSYPDINYTIMRPASLPPSLVDTNMPIRWTASTPALPSYLAGLFSYNVNQPGQANTGNNTFVQLNLPMAPRNQASSSTAGNNFQYIADPGVKNPYLPVQYANPLYPDTGPGNNSMGMAYAGVPPTIGVSGPPYSTVPFATLLASYGNMNTAVPMPIPAAAFPPSIPPTPAARLIQVPDLDTSAATYPAPPPTTPPIPTMGQGFTSNASQPGQTVAVPAFPSSNASVAGQHDGTTIVVQTNPPYTTTDGLGMPYPASALVNSYSVNWPTSTTMLFNGALNAAIYNANSYVGGPPTLIPPSRGVFLQDNNTPLSATTYAPQTSPATSSATATPNTLIQAAANNYLGAGSPANVYGNSNSAGSGATGLSPANDYRQHPLYRTEMLQKIMNLTTVRTHQFAVWITIGFFEVVKPGTPELGLPDILGQELGLTAGRNVRYRSFFTLDRTKATGFNPYYPGNFRDCVTYRRRIE